jgi:hypothetical protein
MQHSRAEQRKNVQQSMQQSGEVQKCISAAQRCNMLRAEREEQEEGKQQKQQKQRKMQKCNNAVVVCSSAAFRMLAAATRSMQQLLLLHRCIVASMHPGCLQFRMLAAATATAKQKKGMFRNSVRLFRNMQSKKLKYTI